MLSILVLTHLLTLGGGGTEKTMDVVQLVDCLSNNTERPGFHPPSLPNTGCGGVSSYPCIWEGQSGGSRI